MSKNGSGLPNRNRPAAWPELANLPSGRLIIVLMSFSIGLIGLIWLAGAPVAQAAEPIVGLRAIVPESSIVAAAGASGQAVLSTRLVIEGSAAGDDFSSAVVEYGRGEFPSQWEPIATLKQPVANGRLAVWETKALPADRYTVRLTFYSKAGVFNRTQQLVDLRSWRSDLAIRQVMSRLDGGTLTVAVDIANQGQQPAPGPVKLVVGLLSDPPTETSSLVRLAHWELTGPLPSGGQASKTGAVTFPPTLQPGRYRVAVVVDEEGSTADADRTNNRAVAGSPVDVGADLVITQLKAELTADGAAVTVTDLIVNKGLLPTTAATTMVYYFSTDGVIQSTDSLLGRRALPPMRAGESSTTATRLLLPAGLASGSYYVLGRVNPPPSQTAQGEAPAVGQSRVAEIDLTNNDYWGSQLTLGPDLALTTLTVQIDAGHRQLVVTDVVKNGGRYQADGPVALSYRLLKGEAAGSATLTPVAIQAAPVIGQHELAGALASGEERRTVTTVSLPEALSAGRYRLIGELDPAQRIMDSDRGNNQRRSDVLVIGYDLEVAALSAEPSSDGLQLRVTETIANQGLLTADGPITVQYFLKDESARAGAERTETLIGRRTIDGGLAPGARSTGTVAIPLPDSAGSRRWRLVASVAASGIDTKAENDRRVTDSLMNEGIDLALGKTTAALSPTADRLTVTDTVKNYGRAALTAPVRVVYALSATGLLDGHETVLGARTIAALAADAESTATTTVTVPPALEPNRYFVIIQVDPDRRVAELKRDNNTTAGQRVNIGPEPVVEAVAAQLKSDGNVMTVKVTVTNRGNRPSGPVGLTFGVSAGNKNAQSVVELGRQSMAPLPPGRRATPDFTLSVPATLPAGAYFVTARLDGQPGDQPPTVTPAALPLGPDLLTQELRAQLIGAGEQLKVSMSDTIVNEGNQGVSRPFTVSYFLSTDWRLDRGDLLLGQRKIDALPAHEQNSATVQFPVPVVTIQTGRYFVLSRIDLEGTVEESDRTNNLRPTVEGLLIDRLEKKKAPDMPDVMSGGQ